VVAAKPGRVASIPSASGGIARMVCDQLRERGIPLAPLLSKTGLSIEQIEDRAASVEVQSQIKILKVAADVLQDDLLGFHLSREYDLREIGLFYYVLASSEVMNDALQKATRYSRITNEGVSLSYRADKEVVISLDYVGIERRSDYHQIEFWLVSLVRLCRQLTNRRLIPSRIALVHHRKNMPAEFRSLLGCEIQFGAGADEVVFPAAIANLPIVSADSHLNQLLIQYCEDALAYRSPARTSLRASVENVMAPLLPHGKANAVEVARRLGMSHRTLARKLSAEGLTFSDIAEELRRDLAGHYLGDTDLPISQIAWLLGYREVSAFTHAFKRWTGRTPRQSRTQKPPAAVDRPPKIRGRLRSSSGRGKRPLLPT
jgi:AraC-like DNA-binding protein